MSFRNKEVKVKNQNISDINSNDELLVNDLSQFYKKNLTSQEQYLNNNNSNSNFYLTNSEKNKKIYSGELKDKDPILPLNEEIYEENVKIPEKIRKNLDLSYKIYNKITSNFPQILQQKPSINKTKDNSAYDTESPQSTKNFLLKNKKYVYLQKDNKAIRDNIKKNQKKILFKTVKDKTSTKNLIF